MGLVGVAASIGLLAPLSADSSLWFARALMFTLGFCMAQVFVPAQAVAFATIPPAETGKASTMFNAVRQLGGAVGVAALTTAVVLAGNGSASGAVGDGRARTASRSSSPPCSPCWRSARR